MDMLEKFRLGARKVGIQATAFAKDSSGRIASGSRDFVQGFSLPSEAEKAAKILDSFLGGSSSEPLVYFLRNSLTTPFCEHRYHSRPRTPRVSPEFHTQGRPAQRTR